MVAPSELPQIGGRDQDAPADAFRGQVSIGDEVIERPLAYRECLRRFLTAQVAAFKTHGGKLAVLALRQLQRMVREYSWAKPPRFQAVSITPMR